MKNFIFLTLLNVSAQPHTNLQNFKKIKHKASFRDKKVLNKNYEIYVKQFTSKYNKMMKIHNKLMSVEKELNKHEIIIKDTQINQNQKNLNTFINSEIYNYTTDHMKEFKEKIKDIDQSNISKKFNYELLFKVGYSLSNMEKIVIRKNYADYERKKLREQQNDKCSQNSLFVKRNEKIDLLNQIISLCSEKRILSREMQKINETFCRFIHDNYQVAKNKQNINNQLSINQIIDTPCSPLSIITDDDDRGLYDDYQELCNGDDQIEDSSTNTTYNQGISESDKSNNQSNSAEKTSALSDITLNTLKSNTNKQPKSQNKNSKIEKNPSNIDLSNVENKNATFLYSIKDNKSQEQIAKLSNTNLNQITQKENKQSTMQLNSLNKDEKKTARSKKNIILSILAIAIILIVIAILYKFYLLKKQQN